MQLVAEVQGELQIFVGEGLGGARRPHRRQLVWPAYEVLEQVRADRAAR
jgi:hypothetical protein